MRSGEGVARKVRSDKKVDVKPTVSGYIKRNLYTYAYLANVPVKDAIELMIEKGLDNDDVLSLFRSALIRDFFIRNRVIFKHREEPAKIRYQGKTETVSTRLKRETYEELCELAFCIGHTPTSTASLMIRKTLYSRDFMEYLTEYHLKITPENKRLLERFLMQMRMADTM